MKNSLKYFFLLFPIIFFWKCSDDSDEAMECKICEEISETSMSAEICDNGDGTVSYTVYVAGQSIFSDETTFEEEQHIKNFDCEYFKTITIEEIEESNR